jgi:hypothetical protein
MRIFFERSRARRLAEVKAILHRLQALSTESGTAVLATGGGNSPHPGLMTRRHGLAAGLGLIVGVATIALAAYILNDLKRSPGPSPSFQATRAAGDLALPTGRDRPPSESLQPSAQAILEKAMQDIAAGHVRAARDALIRIQHQGSADMAWTLARSYDPNFLGEIAQRDAEPNVREAARWYRIWYSRALTDGLVAESVSLERIIRSMPDGPGELPTVK